MSRHGALKAAKVVSTGFVIVLAVGTALLTVIVPRVTGSTSLTVLTGSMTPTIPRGSVVLVKPLDPAEIEVGDVITYQATPGEATYVTHRVIEIELGNGQRSFITKGDANRGADTDPVPAGAVRGRVMFDVPYVGTIADTVKTPLGMLALVGIPCLIYILFQARTLRDEFRARRAKRAGLEAGAAAAQIESANSSFETPAGIARAVLLATVRADLPGRGQITLLAAGLGGSVIDVDGDRIVIMVAAAPRLLDELEAQLAAWPARQIRRSTVVSFDSDDVADLDLDTAEDFYAVTARYELDPFVARFQLVSAYLRQQACSGTQVGV